MVKGAARPYRHCMERIASIWRSFRALPGWVQIWVAVILGPMNLAGFAFLEAPQAGTVIALSLIGMAPNLWFMWVERGFSKIMALPHLLPWTAQVIWLLAVMLSETAPGGAFGAYLWALTGVNTLSLAFDYPDALKWWRGDRAIAGA